MKEAKYFESVLSTKSTTFLFILKYFITIDLIRISERKQFITNRYILSMQL